MSLRPVAFRIPLDGSDVCLEMIPGRRAPQRSARDIDSIVLTLRRSLKARIFLDR